MGQLLVHLISDRAVLLRALASDFVLCSWARHFTLYVPLFHAGNKSAMDSHPSRWSGREGEGEGGLEINTISHLTSLQKREISVSLGHLTLLEG